MMDVFMTQPGLAGGFFSASGSTPAADELSIYDPLVCTATNGDGFAEVDVPAALDTGGVVGPVKGSGLLTRKDWVQNRVDSIRDELLTYGRRYNLGGLESRITYGLDPVGMLAVAETREIIECLAKKLGASMESLIQFTNEMYAGGDWMNLAAADRDPVLQVWSIAADTTGKRREKVTGEFYFDFVRVRYDLRKAVANSEAAVRRAHKNIIQPKMMNARATIPTNGATQALSK